MRGMKCLTKGFRQITALVVGTVMVAVLGFGQPEIPATVQAASGITVSISASISGSNVVVKATASSLPSSDDGQYHLYAENTYDSGVTGTQVATAAVGKTASFSFALNKNSAQSMLYKKFVVATPQGGAMTQVSNASYITNPEAIASHTIKRVSAGKKGILPAAGSMTAASMAALGADQAAYNLPLSQLLNSSGAQLAYNYNGTTYHFNQSTVNAYDSLMTFFKKCNMSVTLIILNDWHSDTTTIHPWSRTAGAGNYYAFNAADQAGVNALAAIGSFLASRYSGSAHGQVDNFIIGNEINARAQWNYMSAVDVSSYAVQTGNAFRVFYNAIKSENSNANVYLPIDQQWSKTSEPARYYPGKTYLDAFNSYIAAEGNIGWDLAQHPYNVMLTNPYSWSNDSSYVNHSADTWFISMQNIEVLTDYMGSTQYLKANGSIRSILCSEVGYTSSAAGEAVQAASITFGYEQAMANQHIDGFILSREVDDAGEMAQGLANGLKNLDGSKKASYDYYANLDTANAQQYLNAAAATIGVSDINSLLISR